MDEDETCKPASCRNRESASLYDSATDPLLGRLENTNSQLVVFMYQKQLLWFTTKRSLNAHSRIHELGYVPFLVIVSLSFVYMSVHYKYHYVDLVVNVLFS